MRVETLDALDLVLKNMDCTQSLENFSHVDYCWLPDFLDDTYLHDHEDENKKKKFRPLPAFSTNMRGLQRTRVQQATRQACI